MELFYDDRNSEIVFIEYIDDKPYSVVTADSWEYDFDWCENHGLYFQMAGTIDGNDIAISKSLNCTHKIYIKNGYRLVDVYGKPIDDAKLKDMNVEILVEPLQLEDGQYNPFEYAIEESTVWCNICKIFYPASFVCKHLFWDDSIECWSGIGYSEHDLAEVPIDDAKDNIISFIMEYGNPKEIMNDLLNNDFDVTRLELQGSAKDTSVYQFYLILGKPAYNWLFSIGDETTKEANMKVASWIKDSIDDR